jgi:hypothetical protein
MSLLWSFLRFYTPKECYGNFELIYSNAKSNDKSEKTDNLKVNLKFKGFLTNGFIDTLVIFTDGERDFELWVPDKSTYLSSTSYDRYGILHINPELDTGVLQGSIDNEFKLEFRIGESSHKANRISAGQEVMYEDYVIPEKMKIKELRIRMYVDPLFVPRLERDYIAETIVENPNPFQ